MMNVLVNNELGFAVDEAILVKVVTAILADHQVQRGELSLVIVDDPTIHDLNRQHLQHDYPTDVLSFVLERNGNELEGEIIVSGETARRAAADFAWSPSDELTLYIVHGCLHLVGYDDQSSEDRLRMRNREAEYLNRVGIVVPAEPGATRGNSPNQGASA